MKEHLETMGPELARLYHELWNQVTWLHIRWHQYVELFGTKPERIDLLNAAASTFFRIVQDSLWDDTLLRLSRLTDPVESGGRKRNLTLKRLPDAIVDEEFCYEVQVLIEKAHEKTTFARDHRNRRIAHRDLDLAFSEVARPLESASRLAVKEALQAVAAVLQHICAHYMKSDLSFEHFSDASEADGLLYVIRDGLEAEERRCRRLEDGDLRPEDFNDRPI